VRRKAKTIPETLALNRVGNWVVRNKMQRKELNIYSYMLSCFPVASPCDEYSPVSGITVDFIVAEHKTEP
jgi:hypothetical protein